MSKEGLRRLRLYTLNMPSFVVKFLVNYLKYSRGINDSSIYLSYNHIYVRNRLIGTKV
jgi:hypothetical protein